MRRTAFIWGLLLLAACAKEWKDLAPFPCTSDYQCPVGFTCTTPTGLRPQCVAGTGGSTGATSSALGAACPSTGCPEGLVCTAPTDGRCVPDCGPPASPARCPATTLCRSLAPYPGHGCLPLAASLPNRNADE